MAPPTREQEQLYPPPERSVVQRMDALSIGTEVRTKRARLKRDLKARKTSIHKVLLNPPSYVDNMKVFDLVKALPQYGDTRINKLFKACGISPSKTVDGLTDRQRDELLFRVRFY